MQYGRLIEYLREKSLAFRCAVKWPTIAISVALAVGMLIAHGQASTQTVATFAPPSLPEGMAIDRQGNVFLSMAPTGELRKLSVDGSQSTYATFRVGEGSLLGLTTDDDGNVYAVVNSGNAPDTDTQGVWRVRPDGSKDLVAGIGGGMGFPNDLAFDQQGNLFVTDSDLGAIWRVAPGQQPAVWLLDPLLAGFTEGAAPRCPNLATSSPIGVNGLAFTRSGDLIVSVTEYGRLVRVPVLADGRAGTPQVLDEDCTTLAGADGITLDQKGNLYVAVNSRNEVERVDPHSGASELLATAADGLDFPSTVRFGRAPGDQNQLYIANFAFPAFNSGGTPRPSLMKLLVP
jgi:sugar lactone lactonase YvrE